MRKVAFVTNRVPDYRYPIFRLLADRHDCELRIFVSSPPAQSCKAAQENLPLHYSSTLRIPFTTRHGRATTLQTELLPIPLSLAGDLSSFRPDVVISGDLGIRSLVCLATARLLGVPFVVWSEEIASSAAGRGALQRRVRRLLARRADAFLAWGSPAKAYLRQLGVEDARIYQSVQAVDVDYWTTLARTLDRTRERRTLGLEGAVYLLVGQLVPRKGYVNFLKAWSLMSGELSSNARAVIVGEGPQEQELKSVASSLGLHNVSFVGPKSATELARYYAAADVFIFPSLEDVWGMAVNEALCFGLPVLGSRFAGATQELLAQDGAGIAFDPTDIEAFAGYLALIQSGGCPGHSRVAQHIAQQHSFARATAAIGSMLDVLLPSPPDHIPSQRGSPRRFV